MSVPPGAAPPSASSPAAAPLARREPWYAAPILWLGIGILAALIAACAATILIALDQDDPSLPIRSEQLFNLPAAHGVGPGRRSRP